MRTERLYLSDIIEASDAIADFIAGLDETSFFQDSKSQSAVLQKLIIIGEAAARLPKEFRGQYPDIEWQDIVAFWKYHSTRLFFHSTNNSLGNRDQRCARAKKNDQRYIDQSV